MVYTHYYDDISSYDINFCFHDSDKVITFEKDADYHGTEEKPLYFIEING